MKPINTILRPDAIMIDQDEPWVRDFGEPYVIYSIGFGTTHDGVEILVQGISVSLMTDDGMNSPCLIAGALVQDYESARWITPDIIHEFCRRIRDQVQSMVITSTGTFVNPNVEHPHDERTVEPGQGDGSVSQPAQADGDAGGRDPQRSSADLPDCGGGRSEPGDGV